MLIASDLYSTGHEPTFGSSEVFVDSSMAVVTATVGTSVNLTCEPMAKGQLTPPIQWHKDGVLIPWETNPFLYLEEVLPSDRGNYSCARATSTTESNSILLDLVGMQSVFVLIMTDVINAPLLYRCLSVFS